MLDRFAADANSVPTEAALSGSSSQQWRPAGGGISMIAFRAKQEYYVDGGYPDEKLRYYVGTPSGARRAGSAFCPVVQPAYHAGRAGQRRNGGCVDRNRGEPRSGC